MIPQQWQIFTGLRRSMLAAGYLAGASLLLRGGTVRATCRIASENVHESQGEDDAAA